MKKFLLLLAAGSLWLFLAAIPALADGGPHDLVKNSGFGTGSTLTSDSCAGCHRAHTAKGFNLIAASTQEELCLSCHGAAGTGATTNVENGVQYALATGGTTVRGAELGALRGGGFVTARINSSDPYRVPYLRSATAVSFHTKVSVLASGAPVTSAHIKLANAPAGVVSKGIVWGSGAVNSGAGVSNLTLECSSCHNPHGNGSYRILLPIPGDGSGPFAESTTTTVVTDAAVPASTDVRNYTVIQTKGGTGTLLASQVITQAFTAAQGDYFRRSVPFDPQGSYLNPQDKYTALDAPNGHAEAYGYTGTPTDGLPKEISFNYQITQWCSSCHTRYLTPYDTSLPQQVPTADSIYKYRHGDARTACTVCHVAHGTNALMTGTNSSAYPYPNDTIDPTTGANLFTSTGDSSRLLKIDNRGTCQACHDPTGTVVAANPPSNASGTLPTLYVP